LDTTRPGAGPRLWLHETLEDGVGEELAAGGQADPAGLAGLEEPGGGEFSQSVPVEMLEGVSELRFETGTVEALDRAEGQEDGLTARNSWRQHLGFVRLRRNVRIEAAQVFPDTSHVVAPGAVRGGRPARLARPGADTKAEHGPALPIATVVARLADGRRVARDLVAREPGCFEARTGPLVEVGHAVVGGWRHAALADGTAKGGAGLEGQAVGRDVFRAEIDDGVEVGFEGGVALVGNAEDQVEGDPFEPGRAGCGEGGVALFGPVGAAEPAQHQVVEGLDADREAIDSGAAEARQPLAFDGARIDLESHLFRLRAVEGIADRIHQPRHRLGREQRRRPASEVDRRQFEPGEVAATLRQLGEQRVDVGALALGRERPRGFDDEVAIGAHAIAERDVQVDPDVAIDERSAFRDITGVAHGPRLPCRGVTEPHIHFETLPNGLTLLLREAHAVPVGTLQIWTRVGSADEAPHEAGLAHFHEHMLFKGTERRGVGEIAGEIEGVGGQINAYTSFDVTVYHATLPSDVLSDGLDVLVDAVRHSTFDEDEITREIGVVLEEIHRSKDSPYSVISEAVFAGAYKTHPYRAPILGSEESVSSITQERLLSFFRRWYAPDRFVVVAAGDFDASELATQVKAAFAGAEPAGTASARPAEPRQRGLRTILLERHFERGTLDLSWVTTNLAHSDTPYLDLLGFVLGEGDSCRLVRSVKERDGLADRIDASSYTPLDAGLFSVTADLDGERVPECLEAISREVERLRQAPPTGDELEKARANFLASEHFERESVNGMAGKLGGFHVLGGDFRLEQTYIDAIREATPDDLLRVARKYLSPEQLTAGVLRNEECAAALSEKDVRDAVERGARSAGESATARPLPAAVPPATTPAPARSGHEASGLASYELGGGVRLHVVPRHDVPVVGIRAAMRGGLLSETRATAGITRFTTDMWLRGTRQRSAADLARAIEMLASDLDGFAGRNSLGLSLDVTSDRLDPALDLFAEVLLEPAFDADELEKERRDTLAVLDRREDRLGVRVFDILQEALYGEHPFSWPVIGSAEAVQAADRAALVEHHERLVRAPNLVLGVAGDVDPDGIAEALTQRLADLPSEAVAAADPPFVPLTERREVELRKEREQAHLALGFPGLTVHDPDRFALEVLAQLLAGQGGRLFLELRDRRSLAYSVSAMNVEGLAPGFFATYIATSPDRLDEAHSGMIDELNRALDAPPDAAALERARRYLIGGHLIGGQRSGSRALRVALDALYDLGPDFSQRYPEMIRSVTAEDVLRVAQRVLDFDRAAVATIRP